MNPNMSPIDWAKRPIEKYADFSGRAPRAEYWWYVLAILIAFAVIKIIENIVGIGGMLFGAYGPLTILLWLATIVPSIAVAIRRLHDTDRSGWWILLPVVPYCIAFALGGRDLMSGQMTGLGTVGIFLLIGAVGGIVLFIFYVLSGTPGDNRYGPNPYGAGGGTTA